MVIIYILIMETMILTNDSNATTTAYKVNLVNSINTRLELAKAIERRRLDLLETLAILEDEANINEQALEGLYTIAERIRNN